MTKKDALFKYLLRLGDNSLILGHRLSEFCSKAPFLEEDIAISNMALDLLGQANALLNYAGKVEANGRTEDELAFLRFEHDFYNTLLSEQPNDDFAVVMGRQFLISVFDYFFYEELKKSNDTTLAAIAVKIHKEISYHLRHASKWIERLGDGTEESNKRMQSAINGLWYFTGELFDMNEIDELLIAENIAVDLNIIKPKWEKLVKEVLERAKLQIPEQVVMRHGSREGHHTEYLGHLLAEMQYLPRAYPDAKW